MKYKKQKSENWFDRIDDKGNKIQFHKDHQPQMYQEMMNSGIPIEDYETQDEIDARLLQEKKDALLKQEKTLLGYFEKYDYHFRTRRKKFLLDIETIWEPIFDKWDDQLDLVRDQIELMNEGKEFTLVQIDPVPVFE